MYTALTFQDEEDSSDQKIETLLTQVNYIMTKIKEQETDRLKEEEQKKQQEWVQKNTGGKS